ncbi:zinc ABC transporter substrate-binding protein [Gordonia sp. NB41Y]|uniref:metal ABC transporter solute-binding protein, Zn/Mn family n=1 Tax=Gordonia sp. NB41Y TaxID=875808 RepID=UPI000344E799|nr:zinc ABC transporter substrate-binding protein [Gordonia sp. NB41Y]EMP12197.2 ABC transporter substrate-binding protein [Gordonia sp. NB41Y]WLP92250.1 zinc ABC transporter substrate-binding protein [Gordonia sp. NB41Y]
MRRALVVGAGLLSAAALALTGCSGDSGSGSDGTPTVVTSTNVWGSVASAVAGDHATVTALYTNADGDPHEFEPSASDTAKVVDASVVVMNGGHYDEYMERATANSDATVINAFDLLAGDHHDHETGTEADSGHDHGDQNEHVFYDLAVVAQVADAVADALADKDSANAAAYHANAERFTGQITGLRTQLADIKKAHDGTEVAQTEPLAGYLLTEAGLVDIAPAGFTSAVEEGQSPSAADRAALQDLLTSRTAKVFIYNTQAVDPVTEALLTVAQNAKVPVVKFTETLPDGVTDYIAWQHGQITALADALNTPPA